MYNGKVTNFYTKQPMANVQVSDGMNIVYTDKNGCFSLPGWEKAHVINVNMLTKSHNDWYKNIDEHEGDFDFCVKPAECSDSFSFFHVSDTEIEGRATNDWMDFVRETVKNEKPLFFINTGDLCREDGLARTYLLMNSETAGCPVRYSIGNHDMCDGYGEKRFEKHYGPTWFSFDCGQIHFVVLDIGAGDTMSGYTKTERMKWLKKDLELKDKNKGVIVFSHYFHPNPKGYGHTVAEMAEIAGDKGLKACIFGHDHYNYVYHYDNFLGICSSRPDSGGIDSTPAGIRKISISGTDITTEYIYNIPESADYPDKSEWCTALDGNIEFSNPIESDGAVWVCTNDDGYPKECGIYKLDAVSGKVLSYIKTGGIKGDAALSGGRLYAQDTEGVLYCINTCDGKLLWQNKSDVSKTFYTRSGVFVIENKVIAGSPAKLHAYNKDTGELLWISNVGGCEGPGRYIFDEKRRQLIVGRHWLGVYGINIDTGEQLWENKENPLCWFNTSTPLLCGDVIYKIGLTSAGIIDAQSGETISKTETKIRADVSGQSVIDENLIYVPTTSFGVVALDKNTFEHKITFPCGNARLYTSPYVSGEIQTVETTPYIAGDKLIFGASDGYVYIYNKNTARLLKKINVDSPILATPVIKDGYIITADFSGKVKKFII